MATQRREPRSSGLMSRKTAVRVARWTVLALILLPILGAISAEVNLSLW